ncbi:helix-turn-helix domain-containing protein [Spirosoma areae]
MDSLQPCRIKTITEYHRLRNLPKPEHPLISIITVNDVKPLDKPISWVLDFYSIALKRNFGAKFKYGQQRYDFDEGILFFMAPGQVFSVEPSGDTSTQVSGWIVLVHPDFLWNTNLAKQIRQYDYFGYSVHEALFLSEKEEGVITNIIGQIQHEYQSNIDSFSQNIIIAQLEVLLNYAERFYQRQFITRKITSHKILERVEAVLWAYFNVDDRTQKGLPTVQYVAGQLNISPNYLSGLLKTQTGQSTQQHIHDKLIEKAKEKLSTTELSISEIAYALGFEHAQSFSKLFKSKTNCSPLEFRQSFN